MDRPDRPDLEGILVLPDPECTNCGGSGWVYGESEIFPGCGGSVRCQVCRGKGTCGNEQARILANYALSLEHDLEVLRNGDIDTRHMKWRISELTAENARLQTAFDGVDALCATLSEKRVKLEKILRANTRTMRCPSCGHQTEPPISVWRCTNKECGDSVHGALADECADALGEKL